MRPEVVARRAFILSAALALLVTVAVLLSTPTSAGAAGMTCARTADPNTPAAPSQGSPCWVDEPYPFGSDGNPGDPNQFICDSNNPNAPCELQVTSMAFRAWNRGLAAASFPGATGTGNLAFGVWLFNGANWFPDPTFPGSASCPGSTLLWAGKLDYWLVGGTSSAAEQTLCRFDGVNLVWEELSLPAATLARLPIDPLSQKPRGGITTGACYAWNNCWFFGSDGIEAHWDGQVLSDASSGEGSSPWLQGDFTGAVAQTDPAGNEFGLATTSSGSTAATGAPGAQQLPSEPDGSPPPQLFGSQGGPFAPLPFSPPANPQPGDPYTTDLLAVASDPQGNAWVAGDPTNREPTSQPQPAPLLRLTEAGARVQCTGYDGSTFTYSTIPPFPAAGSYLWTSLSVSAAEGSALAGVENLENGQPEPFYNQSGNHIVEPALVRAACGQPPSVTRFRIPDPFFPDPATAPLIPADLGGSTTAVTSNASNDAWAATTVGSLGEPPSGGVGQSAPQPPHLYRWTDGQTPNAPAGDDNEPRPSLFTLDAPVYVPTPPTVVAPSTTTTTTTPAASKKVKLKPAIYAIHSKLRRGRNGKFMLTYEFSIRRPVTIGVQALWHKTVVASSGLRHFTGRHGQLALTLDRKRWPTRVRFVAPKTPKA